jgi:catechol 2,3-dioxygenase-like lactoylglutathione lyase family enzyme
MHIGHINIRAPAALLERERQFFRDILGLLDGPRPDFSSKGYWLYADDRPIVHLSQSQQALRGAPTGYLDHVAFRGASLDALLQRLQRQNIEYSTARLDELGMTQVFFKSPSNTGIEVNFIDETV